MDFRKIYHCSFFDFMGIEERYYLIEALQDNTQSEYCISLSGAAQTFTMERHVLMDIFDLLRGNNWDDKKNGKFKPTDRLYLGDIWKKANESPDDHIVKPAPMTISEFEEMMKMPVVTNPKEEKEDEE